MPHYGKHPCHLGFDWFTGSDILEALLACRVEGKVTQCKSRWRWSWSYGHRSTLKPCWRTVICCFNCCYLVLKELMSCHVNFNICMNSLKVDPLEKIIRPCLARGARQGSIHCVYRETARQGSLLQDQGKDNEPTVTQNSPTGIFMKITIYSDNRDLLT